MKNIKDNIRLFFLFACMVFVSANVSAQQFTITSVSSSERLPVSGVNCLMQDDEGYMWYGTNDAGLCRDDGYQVVSFGYNAAPDIMHNSDVLCILDGGDQRIWFGTREGLYILDKRTYTISKTIDEVDHLRIVRLAKASDNSIWVIASARIAHLSQSGELLGLYDSMHNGSARTTNDIFVDKDDNVWVAQWKGDLLLKKAGEEEFKIVEGLKGLDAFYVAQDTVSGCYYIGTWGYGIYRIEPDMKKVIPTSIDDGCFSSLLVDSRRNILWATTYNQGVRCYSRFNDDLYELHTRFDEQLHMPMVTGNIISDRFSNPWVPGYSVNTFAICYSNNQIDSRKIYANRNSFGMPVITDVVDAGTHAWLLRESGGVVYYDSKKDEGEKLEFCSDTAVVAPASDGRVFVVNKDRNIWLISKKYVGYEQETWGHLNFNANSMVYSASDRVLYVGGKNGRLAAARRGQNPTILLDSLGWIFKVCESVDMRSLYALSYIKGVMRIDKTTLETTILAPNDYKFSDIAVSASGSLWVSSYLGKLYKIVDDQAVECPEFESPNGESVLRMTFDELDHLWLLSKSFVREIDVATGAMRTIYATDNQLGMQTFEGLTASEGGVTVAGVGGIARIRSSSNLREASRGVRMAISEYSYGGKRFIVGYGQDRIVIPADLSDFVTVSLTNFDYLKAANNEFKVKIEGLSRDWVTLKRGENEIQIQSLGKGTYRIMVMATDGFGKWGEPCELMTIERLPAWWESWWAYTIYILLLLLLLYGIWRFNRDMHERRLRFESLLSRYSELERKVQQTDTTSEKECDGESADEMDDNQSQLSIFDSELLEQAISMIEKNISNENYSVDEFASDMCMSRMTLYRKIYSVSGQTPSDLIRSYRLDKAAKLLQSTNYSVVDISERVGFSSSRYFSTCFKNKYGVLPKDFRK